MNDQPPRRETCPSDEQLAAYVEQRSEGPDHEHVEAHVAGCTTCLDVVAACLPSAATPAPMPIAPGHPRATSGWRRWAIAAALVLVAGGALVRALERPIGLGLAQLAGRFLGPALRVEHVALHLGRTPGSFEIALGSVRIGKEPHALFDADRIGVTLALAAPLFGDPVVSAIQVVHPTIELMEPPSLKLVWPTSDRGDALAMLRDAARVEVVDARLVVRRLTGPSFEVERLNGGIERTANGATLVLQGAAGAGTIDVVGTLADADHGLALTIAGRDIDAATLPILARRVTGVADFRLDLAGPGDALRGDGRIAVRNGRVVGRGPTRLVALDRATRAALASADSGFAESDLPFDEARAVFAWHKGTWRLPRVYLAKGATLLGGRVRVGSDGAVTGHGTLRLPATLVASLAEQAPTLARFRDANGDATLPFGVGGSLDVPTFDLGRP